MHQPGLKYIYVYRVDQRGEPGASGINWEEPTGGLVVPAYTTPLEAIAISRDRYHCAPWEEIIIAEVWEEPEKWQAKLLHEAWEQEYSTWIAEGA